MARLLVALGLLAVAGAGQERSPQELFADAQRLCDEGEFEGAAATLRDAVRIAEARGVGPKDRAHYEGMLAGILQHVGRPEEAEAHARSAVDLLAGATSPLDEDVAYWRSALAAIEGRNGKLDEAEIDACTALQSVEGSAPAIEVQSICVLAAAAFHRRHYAGAATLLQIAAKRAVDAHLGAAACAQAWLGIAALATETGAYDVAENALRDLRASYETRRPDVSEALQWALWATELRIRQGRLDDAEEAGGEILEEAGPAAKSTPIPYAALAVALARVAVEKDDLEKAGELLARAERALRRPGYDTRAELAALLETRADLRRRKKDTAGARTDLGEALVLRSWLGENGLAAARTLLALAELESDAGDHEKAMDFATRSTRIFLRELGATEAEAEAACKAFRKIWARRELARSLAGLEKGDPSALKGVRVGDGLEPDAADIDARVRAIGERVKELSSQKDWEGALRLLDEALELRPGESWIHGGRAEALASMKRNQDAIAARDAEILWSLGPAADAYALRAYHQWQLHRYERTIVDATYSMVLGGDNLALRKMRGTARAARGEKGDLDLGLRDLDAVIKESPNDTRIQSLRGLVLWELGRFDEAATVLRASIASGVSPASAYAKLAEFERRQGHVDEALALATKAIDLDATDTRAYGVRGFLRLDRGEWKDALADFDAWAEPPSLDTRILCWICRTRMGERQAATEDLRPAAKEDDALRDVARAILGDRAEPADAGKSAPPETQCRAHFLLGAWREIEGDQAGAKAHYEQAVATGCQQALEYRSAEAALARLAAPK